MAEIALKLKDQTPDQIRQLALEAKAGLTNNPHFPDGGALAAALAAKIAAYDTKVEVRAAKLAALTLADIDVQTALDDICAQLRKAKADCEAVTKDRDALASTKLPLKGEARPVGDMPQPANFVVTRGDREGDADGQCHKVDGARTYKTEHSLKPDGPWTIGYEGTKSSFTIKRLTPGAVYYFRMAALGPNGWGPWSSIASCRIA